MVVLPASSLEFYRHAFQGGEGKMLDVKPLTLSRLGWKYPFQLTFRPGAVDVAYRNSRQKIQSPENGLVQSNQRPFADRRFRNVYVTFDSSILVLSFCLSLPE